MIKTFKKGQIVWAYHIMKPQVVEDETETISNLYNNIHIGRYVYMGQSINDTDSDELFLPGLAEDQNGNIVVIRSVHSTESKIGTPSEFLVTWRKKELLFKSKDELLKYIGEIFINVIKQIDKQGDQLPKIKNKKTTYYDGVTEDSTIPLSEITNHVVIENEFLVPKDKLKETLAEMKREDIKIKAANDNIGTESND